MSVTTRLSKLKPVSTRVRLRRLSVKSRATTTITSDRANWATTSARCHPNRPRLAVNPRLPARMTDSSGAEVARSAGANPKRIVVATAVAAVNPRTRQSRAMGTESGSRPVLRYATSAALIPRASMAPSRVPRTASSRLSDSNWRMTRPRDAPVARRTAISRARAPALASSRFARLAHATSRTSADNPRSSQSGASYRVRNDEKPPPRGTASNRNFRYASICSGSRRGEAVSRNRAGEIVCR